MKQKIIMPVSFLIISFLIFSCSKKDKTEQPGISVEGYFAGRIIYSGGTTFPAALLNKNDGTLRFYQFYNDALSFTDTAESMKANGTWMLSNNTTFVATISEDEDGNPLSDAIIFKDSTLTAPVTKLQGTFFDGGVAAATFSFDKQ